MALTFEFEQKVADGVLGMAVHYPGEIAQVFSQDGSGNLDGATVDVPEGDFTPTLVFDSVGVCAKQVGVEYPSLHMYSTDGIYGSWLYGDKQQLVIFLLEWDLSDKLDSARIVFDITNPVPTCNFSFKVTPDMFIEDQGNILNPGCRVRIRYQSGDSVWYEMGRFFGDRSSGQDLNKTATVEGRGMIGKPLQDQSYDESYDYPYATVNSVIEDILDMAGYAADEYLVETTTDQVGMTFDRKKTIYDGLQEILEAQNWQLRERPEGYLVIGSSTYTEFDTPGDYEFTYGDDCYSRGFVEDDGEAFTRVCVHTESYGVAVYDDVDVYTSWQIGNQKTYYLEVADGTTLASATTIAADLATKLSNVGTIETYGGPFRPYLIPGDTAKITQDSVERTVGVITNIRHTLGPEGFMTEFDVDSGGVAGVGRLKDYIKGLQKKPTNVSSRSYS